MTEEVLFKVEKRMENSEIAEYLRNIAGKIDKGEKINLSSGDQKVELETDRPTEFEIKAERENGEESLELELEWKENKSSEELSIQ